jgi:hypothetical protein|tara:strand:+ start:448 stop:699 length:252 start_codon:yes stop_codon:yes gene_type:complete
MIEKGQIINADIKIKYKYKTKYKVEWINDTIFTRPYSGSYPKINKESNFFKRYMPDLSKRHNICDIEVLNIKNIIKLGFKNNR